MQGFGGCTCHNRVASPRKMPVPRSCPRHGYSTMVRSWTKKFAFASLWLGFSVKATITISRAANGLSISPNVAFHGIVPDDSPGFSLVSKYGTRRSFRGNSYVNNIIREFQSLFDKG
ncbi:hypothetical protein BJX68DRAFT_248611 [Aspergillus pseudodeflectus]|uniref:Uncharacterized protein n=1 Tax=Aspergillus pseudodeflectus TaxID=176178 RepID=A0ABR4JFF1_9EURO